MMRYFPQVWASDNTDAIHVYQFSTVHPISIQPFLWGLMSTVPNHQMGRMTPLETRGHVAMMEIWAMSLI